MSIHPLYAHPPIAKLQEIAENDFVCRIPNYVTYDCEGFYPTTFTSNSCHKNIEFPWVSWYYPN